MDKVVPISVIPTKDYTHVLRICYESDKELLDKYHVLAPTTLENAVKNTRDVFMSTLGVFQMKKVLYGDDFAGYYGIERFEDRFGITGFFVMPKYRNKEFLSTFVSLIKSEFNGDIYCGVYDHNARAINFLLKSGFQETTRINKAVYYILKQH